MDTRVRKFRIKKASACLLFLCVTCAFALISNATNAKKPPAGTITIDQGTATPSNASIGQEVDFSASYSTALASGEYAIHACKSKKMSAEAFCQDGSWCVSGAFTADNPLACKFTPRVEDSGSNQYFIFICNKEKQCSTEKPGTFTVGTSSVLSLQAPEKIDFQSVPFSFSSQTSAGNCLDALTLTSNSTGNAGWSLDMTAADWRSGSTGSTLDFDGDGSTTGQLTANLDTLSIESTDPINGIKPGTTASFSADIKTINIATAKGKNGNGTFTFKNIKFDQFVPGNQQGGGYKTILTFTIS